MWFGVRGGSFEEAIWKTGGRRTLQLCIVIAREMEKHSTAVNEMVGRVVFASAIARMSQVLSVLLVHKRGWCSC